VPQVEVPSRYRVPTKGESSIDVEGRTVRECIDAVEARYPGFRELIVDGKGEVQRFVRLFVNGEQLARDGLDTAVSEDARIAILVAPAGG
jgi:molybdopterin synthase sulfur carrier subunit